MTVEAGSARLVDIRRRLVHRLDHLDAAVMQMLARPAGSGTSVTKVWIWLRWAMRNGALRRSFFEFRDQHDTARIGDDRLRRLHLAIVEVEQSALLIDRGCADNGVVDLELADQAVAVEPITAPSARRTAPPATITSMRG